MNFVSIYSTKDDLWDFFNLHLFPSFLHVVLYWPVYFDFNFKLGMPTSVLVDCLE